MSKKGKAFVLNRKDYNRIQRMDHCTMTLWAKSIYKSGFEDGAEAAKENALNTEQVRSILLGLKGYGERRVSEICSALEESFEDKGIDA